MAVFATSCTKSELEAPSETTEPSAIHPDRTLQIEHSEALKPGDFTNEGSSVTEINDDGDDESGPPNPKDKDKRK